jgi:hypothetical protein
MSSEALDGWRFWPLLHVWKDGWQVGEMWQPRRASSISKSAREGLIIQNKERKRGDRPANWFRLGGR